METKKESLYLKLVEFTRKLGRQATFEEVSADVDMPDANEYAFYFGSFTRAAERAWASIYAKTIEGGIRVLKKAKPLDPEREKYVIDEIVDMYIANNGEIPTDRMVKKNPLVTVEEVSALRRMGKLQESKLHRMAEEKTGMKFLSPSEKASRRYEKMKKQHDEMKAKMAEAVKAAESKKVAAAEKAVEEVKSAEEPKVIEEAKVVEETVSQPVVNEQVPEGETTKTNIIEENKEGKVMGRGRKKRFNEEGIKEALLKECTRVGHILKRSEVEINYSNMGLPSYPTIVKYVGEWWNWDSFINLPFEDEATAELARVLKEGIVGKRRNSQKKTYRTTKRDKILKGTVPVIQEEDETVVSEKTLDESGELKEILIPKSSEKETSIPETEMREIPIKLVVPKGISGTVTIVLNI